MGALRPFLFQLAACSIVIDTDRTGQILTSFVRNVEIQIYIPMTPKKKEKRKNTVSHLTL